MNKPSPFIVLIILFFNFHSNAQTTLTHNICNDVIKTMNHSCSYSYIYFGRTFDLDNFGVTGTDEFTITHGEVGLTYAEGGASIQFNIYAIDADFPNSFDESNLIGQSQEYDLPYIWSPGTQTAQIFTVAFENPVVIPANIDMILVEVKKGLVIGGSGLIHVAGTLQDNDASYYRGCVAGPDYINTVNLTYGQSTYPPADYNFYITAVEDFINIDIPFRAYLVNECEGLNKYFQLTTPSLIQNVAWNFGDPSSGASNISTQVNPSHVYSSPGLYTVTASVTNYGNQTYTTTKTITAQSTNEIPVVNDIFACEDTFGSGISSSFDTSNIEAQIVNGQTGVVVSYYDQNGNQLPSPLPNPLTNTQPNSQQITIRVAANSTSSLCCYNETTFNLITYTLPEVTQTDAIFSCDNDENGFSNFDLSNLPTDLINGQSGLTVDLFNSNNAIIASSDYANFTNLVANQDTIKAVVTDDVTSCASVTTINLIISPSPIAYSVNTLLGCDDNNDGFSEYFDTSDVEAQVLNGQTGINVTYFTENGTQLSSPLSNPYTNIEAYNQNIIVRVTNATTTCYQETTLQLQTVIQPSINQPTNLFACDNGNGYADFDTTSIEQQIIGNQTGVSIQYYDSNNSQLPSPLPALFQNTLPFSQTIYVKVEDISNPICYSETSFDLIVNSLPEVDLEEDYFICNLQPFLTLTVNPSFSFYQWSFEDGNIVSSTFQAIIENEGNYTLTVGQLENNIICENSFSFHLTRSNLPEIQDVNYGELGNNFIEIIASGDGDFEYSIDGLNYQDSNYFANIQGGSYTVFVRDKDGCGADSQEVTIIDYPKFFTPNGDDINEFWQIKGVNEFPDSQISIFDRYGKLLKQLSANSSGWDGTYNGKKMSSNDYWFVANLSNGTTFSGHFALKR